MAADTLPKVAENHKEEDNLKKYVLLSYASLPNCLISHVRPNGTKLDQTGPKGNKQDQTGP